jgi:hypothetical protein
MKISNRENSWLVQLATRTNRKINGIIKGFQLDIDGVSIVVDPSIIPLGLYDVLVGMNWLNVHHVVLDCHDKTFTYLDEEGE